MTIAHEYVAIGTIEKQEVKKEFSIEGKARRSLKKLPYIRTNFQ